MLRSIQSTVCALALATASCVLAPPGHDAERERMLAAGRPYADPFEQRTLPELGPCPTRRELLERAFLSNGDLERAYFEWRAAVERVEMAAGWPNTDLMPSFSYMFSSGSMSAWDRTTVSLAFDPSENLELPSKTRKAAEIALAEARAAGEEFRMAKFDLQRRVLEAWLELVLAEQRARLARADLELLRAVASSAGARVQAGGAQRDLLQADIQVARAEDRARALEAEAHAQRAVLNGLLARDARAPLDVGEALPEPRPLPQDDEAILAAGVHQNPHLVSLVEETAGREGALELAQMRYLPNLNPFAAFTGDVSQVVGVGVMLPTTLPEIRAGIAEARALLAAERALVRQAHQDHAAHFVATLTALRDSERQAELFEGQVLPAAELLATATRQAYAAGSAGLLELIEAQRTLLDVRLLVAEARIERERRAAEIEELTGIDLEALAAAGEVSREG